MQSTLAYLQADYRLEQAILKNADSSRSRARGLAAQLGSECHGVLAGAPSEEEPPLPPATTTPRARGERQRSELQRQTIEEELLLTFEAAAYQPDKAAVEAYAAQVSTLNWSDPRIAPLAQFEADGSEQVVTPPTTSVCADMKTWQQSGYHLLSAGSREFQAAQTARAAAVRPEGSLGALLKPYEGPGARALIRRTAALHAKVKTSLAWLSTLSSHLDRALGVRESRFEAREQEPVVGHGRTETGSSFTVSRERRRASSHSCRSVSVSITTTSKAPGGSSSSDAPLCISGSADRHPASGCENGVWSVTAAVPASVRTVRLRVSGGRTIVSRVVQVPRRDGGPDGVYVQEVRGSATVPVSLTELNASGGVVLVVRLKATHCRREPPPAEGPPEGPTYVTLASGVTPGGEPFSIEGSLVHFHFAKPQTSFNLLLTLAESIHEEDPQSNPQVYPWSLAVDCPPHESAVIYGVLLVPGDSVLARTSEGLVPLTTVPIAAELNARGPLVYGVFSTVPQELVVRNSEGSTLYTESLAMRADEEAEFCAGYEEA